MRLIGLSASNLEIISIAELSLRSKARLTLAAVSVDYRTRVISLLAPATTTGQYDDLALDFIPYNILAAIPLSALSRAALRLTLTANLPQTVLASIAGGPIPLAPLA